MFPLKCTVLYEIGINYHDVCLYVPIVPSNQEYLFWLSSILAECIPTFVKLIVANLSQHLNVGGFFTRFYWQYLILICINDNNYIDITIFIDKPFSWGKYSVIRFCYIVLIYKTALEYIISVDYKFKLELILPNTRTPIWSYVWPIESCNITATH